VTYRRPPSERQQDDQGPKEKVTPLTRTNLELNSLNDVTTRQDYAPRQYPFTSSYTAPARSDTQAHSLSLSDQGPLTSQTSSASRAPQISSERPVRTAQQAGLVTSVSAGVPVDLVDTASQRSRVDRGSSASPAPPIKKQQPQPDTVSFSTLLVINRGMTFYSQTVVGNGFSLKCPLKN